MRELGHPPGEPLVVARLDLLRGGRRIARRFLRARDFLDQRRERELRVAQHRERARHVLVHIGRIDGVVDDCLADRHRDAEVRLRERAADAENEVRLFEEVVHRRRDREATRAERERMRFGKRALALQAGGDRNGEQLGELLQLAPRFRPVHALARIEHRAFRREQHFRRLADRIRIGA